MKNFSRQRILYYLSLIWVTAIIIAIFATIFVTSPVTLLWFAFYVMTATAIIVLVVEFFDRLFYR